ncbi:acyl-homoserine-lactone synthase [Shinella sumterensis]|uniref:acyl-homoserine-lactone synthase n=1 Tax=Shinella sumterensis TaxID=1967501 RepID=UPI003F859C60
MLRTLTKNDRTCAVYEEMLRGRARIFQDRMNWDVSVHDGKEVDWYDLNADPIYIVALNGDGHVVGSLRVLPTVGPTMLAREFRTVFRKSIDVQCPTTWECTRFCVHSSLKGGAVRHFNASAELLSGLCELALQSGIKHIIAVYEPSMERLYRRLGWSPTCISTSWPWLRRTCCGLWDVTRDAAHALRQRASEF